MMMPSIALPTGPYDWHREISPREGFEARLAALRAAMAPAGVTHCVVHGNGFDHSALNRLTHFTPKLGPAYALVPAQGPLRLLFAGGPGMNPSAQRLTWVEDVAAIKSVEGDIKRWLEEAGAGVTVRLGLVEGSSMLRGDWLAVQRAAGGEVTVLDDALPVTLDHSAADAAAREKAAEILTGAYQGLGRHLKPGADLRHIAIEIERACYAAGAQDARVLIGRRAGGPPTTPPDDPMPMTGPVQAVIAVRYRNAWAHRRMELAPI